MRKRKRDQIMTQKRKRDQVMTRFAWLVAAWAVIELVILLYKWGAFNPNG